MKTTISALILLVLIAASTAVECPWECHNSCCETEQNELKCCPFENGVCCADSKTCCPQGSRCDNSGRCMYANGSYQTTAFLNSPQKIIETVKSMPSEVKCGDNTTYCPDETTCCPLSQSMWGCCPMPSATCCSDHLHCCPHGYKCDVLHATCTLNDVTHGSSMIKTNLPSSETYHACPDGVSQCDSDRSCCKSSDGQWDCCPLPKKIIETVKSTPSEVKCGDNATYCPDETTCCPLSQSMWGCCPMPSATCCSDHLHCCPHGYKCDVLHATCTLNDVTHGSSMIKTNLPSSEAYHTCPDGVSQCDSDRSCCKSSDGQWDCCPLPKN